MPKSQCKTLCNTSTFKATRIEIQQSAIALANSIRKSFCVTTGEALSIFQPFYYDNAGKAESTHALAAQAIYSRIIACE